MVEPRGFRVDYAINPYMTDESGQLKVVNGAQAFAQWSALKNVFESLGIGVKTLSGDEALPDIVFCANQTFPYIDKSGQMRSCIRTHATGDQFG